jgi:WD40 repeat protein
MKGTSMGKGNGGENQRLDLTATPRGKTIRKKDETPGFPPEQENPGLAVRGDPIFLMIWYRGNVPDSRLVAVEGFSMRVHPLLTAFILVLTLGEIVAAPPPLDRRSRDEPEIVIEAGGRSGPADVVTYTPNGQHLLIAGDDKVVRQWPVTAAGLETNPDKMTTFRWPAWREQRGGIKAIALSPDAKKIAVGGFGLRISNIAILDRETQDVVAMTWPDARQKIDSFNAIMAVAYHPDGEHVAFGTADGSLFLWKPRKLAQQDDLGRWWSAPARVGRHDRLKPQFGSSEFNFPRVLFFRDAQTLISVAQSGEVLQCDVSGKTPPVYKGEPPAAQSLFNVNDGTKIAYAVHRAAVVPGGKWLAIASTGPQVILRSLEDPKQVVTLPLKEGQFPRSLAVSAKGDRLAVSVASIRKESAFYDETDDEIRVYPLPLVPETQPEVLAHRGPAEAMGWHPKGLQLAVAGGHHDEVTVYTTGEKKAQPIVTRGGGRKIWGVALSENGRLVSVQPQKKPKAETINQRAEGPRASFNLSRLKLNRADPTWLAPIEEADGWKVIPDRTSRFKWIVRHTNGTEFTLPWDQPRDQAPTCYTFLPAMNGAATRLIVGHYYGCSVFELGKTGATRTKLYTGHTGEVLSVCAAKDQTWFVTGGSDQTVCAWSLVDWPNQPVLGAKFAAVEGGPVVTAVEIGSPAYEAGLSVGDQIVSLAVGGEKIVFDRLGATPIGTPAEALAAFKNAVPGIELSFWYKPKAGGELARNLTTVRQRPLWKWFADFDSESQIKEWVIWMWKGSYYHTSTNGDRLVGWHVNHPLIDGKPEFFNLNQFQKQYHKESVVQRLVNTGSVKEALEDAWQGNPQRISFQKFEPAPVRVEPTTSTVGENGVQVKVIAEQRGLNRDLLPETVELWLNDFRVKVWNPNGKAVREVLTLPAEFFRSGDNQITVLTFNQVGGRGEDKRFVLNERPAENPQLLGLSVGVNDYGLHRRSLDGTRKGFDDLRSAVNDATILKSKLDEFRGPERYFRGKGLEVRLDAQAQRETVTETLKKLAHEAKANDHLIVFFAGHGDLLKEGDFPQAGQPGARGVDRQAGNFVFCLPNYSPKTPDKTALSAGELFELLANIRCRKTVLFDACHSGQAADTNLIRRFVPDGQGPVVIAACDQTEFSYEHPDPKIGHGLFTLAILEAIGPKYRKADLNNDGVVSTEELYQYVSFRVQELSREVTKNKDLQVPISFPKNLPQTVFVRK